jgi:hypothetical protein
MRSAGGDDQRQANLTATRRVKKTKKYFLEMVAKEAFGIHGQSIIVEHEKLIPGLRLVQVLVISTFLEMTFEYQLFSN